MNGENVDNADYYRFTGPQRIDKAMHTLEGLVQGIAIDALVNDAEVELVRKWVENHNQFANLHPFNEVIPRLCEILDDGIIDEEERADILWLCDRFTSGNQYFDYVTADMQRLQGVLGGICADKKITVDELTGLQVWLEMHSHLRNCWPYDELQALLNHVLKDGIIDDNEHCQLMAFFREFVHEPGHATIDLTEGVSEQLVSGVCAMCPEIEFAGSVFCFTGKSERCTRKEFQALIKKLGGEFSNSVTNDVNYLTIGADGNPCWSYSCYGRKVEQAIAKRKGGGKILIVHEFDIWDAIEDL